MKFFVVLFATLCCVSALPPLWRQGLRAPPTPPGAKLPEAQWTDQKLDHFDKSVTATWRQRYFVNDSYWDKQNGPVFLLLGGEGPADPAWIVADTEIMLNAQKYKALVISIEHRYYGESHPTSDLSTANLKYLSSRQSLADVADFYSAMKTKFNMTASNRWISFGGSYSGALSAWLRLLYQNVVVGAVATSAPVQAVLDFSQYLEVVSASLGSSSHGAQCVNAVREATTVLDQWLSEEKTWSMAEKTFNIFPPLESQLDVALAAQNLAGNFMGVVQYNKDNTAFEGRPNNITIEDLCSIMVNASLGAPIARYAAVNKMMTDNEQLDCNYKSYLREMSNTSWNSDVAGGARQWYYQTCTEFGYFQTTDSTQQPFGKYISLASYLDVCSQVFGISQSTVNNSVTATNNFYKGKHITSTNIVFPNGSIDPWHQLSILKDPSPFMKAFYIHGTAHCANMYPPSAKDPAELTQARINIADSIATWLM